MVIRADDRVGRILESDDGLVEVFAAVSPHFARLRNPAMRRVMGRLVTVEQAARIAGVDVEVLLRALNGGGTEGREGTEETEGTEGTEEVGGMPEALRALPAERLMDLDVREELRRGHEPFSLIMAAKHALPEGHVLRLRAVFEPVPLYHVLGKQGFAHWTEELAADDWRVWFYRADAVAAGDAAPTAVEAGEAGEAPAGEGVVVLDVRGMEPPEPLVRTLAALEALPAGGTLVQINVRVPQFLLPRLDELGFVYEVREQGDGLVRVFIRRREER